ncbi:MAG: response regulator [Symploca sp. SIO2C1]|nr:response regulator [Symploca sp. SIO2C1]
MTFEEALTWVESTLQSKINKQLTPSEKEILRAAWENETYNTVADNLYLSVGYIKDLASRLWKCLSNLLEAKVTKSNFRYLFLERSTTLNHTLAKIEYSHTYQREDSKGNILIIDQLIDNLDFLSYTLTKEGYKVHCVTDSNLALRTVRNNLPDVILLEINISELVAIDL